MNSKYIALILTACLIFLSLNACASTFKPVYATGIPISLPDTSYITMDTILMQVDQQVQKYVPGAYASSLTFLGQCEDLDEMVGKINIGYVRIDRKFRLRARVIVGIVSIDKLNETMEMQFEDHTEHYPLTIPPSALAENLLLFDVAKLANNHIESLAVSNCDITLTYLGDTWHVLCTESGSGPLGAWLCAFEIDNVTLQILEP